MKLDLGLMSIALPEGSEMRPAIVMFGGKTDKGAALSAGPTMAKTQNHELERTIAISIAPFDIDAEPDDVMTFGLNELQKRTSGKVGKVQDVTLSERPGKSVELRYTQPQTKMPVMTRAYLLHAKGYLITFALTALDNAKTLPVATKEFDSFVLSVQLPDALR